jgi:hypothetical protein
MGIKIEPNDSLRDDLEYQLHIAPELENFVKTTMVGPQESTIDRRKACIFMALASKSFTTFQAIVSLLQSRLFLEDAAVLVRVLYESTMTATFLLYSDERAVDDYADFFMYRNWRDHQLVKAVDPVVAEKALRPEDREEMESQFNQAAARYSNGRWTSLSAETMAKFADKHLPNGFKVFTILYASIYRQCSAYVHSDVRSIQAHIQENTDGVVSISKPISKEHCGKLMHAANFLMLTICFVVTGTFYGTKHIPQWNSLGLKWNGNQPLT